MHGNASSQHEGLFLIPNICKYGVALYCFDFAGCGESDGDFISLGHFETMDLHDLIGQLILSFNLGPFVLWGRSMGAAVALMCTHTAIKARVVDSSYTSVPDVIASIAQFLKMPGIFVPAAVWFLKRTIAGKADFDLSKISPLKSARRCQPAVPLLICHASDDQFIPLSQDERIQRAYAHPDKDLVVVEGGHNGKRPLSWIERACKFCMDNLGVTSEGFEAVRFVGLHQVDQHFKSYDDLLRFMNKNGTVDTDVDSPVVQGMIKDGGLETKLESSSESEEDPV
jgi:pimeloyl-ACP methyl ester carboxylesterase